jgi:hypothetical protein
MSHQVYTWTEISHYFGKFEKLSAPIFWQYSFGIRELAELVPAYICLVVNWSTIHPTFILSLLKGLHAKPVDFIQTFTQVPLDCLIYVEIPASFHIVDGRIQFAGESIGNTDKTYVLKLLKTCMA